jgi:hypothetical protein
MLGERSAPSGSMFLGRRVDDTISLYYQRILDHGDRLDLKQLKHAYRDGWRADEEAERASLGIGWEDGVGDGCRLAAARSAVALRAAERFSGCRSGSCDCGGVRQAAHPVLRSIDASSSSCVAWREVERLLRFGPLWAALGFDWDLDQ